MNVPGVEPSGTLKLIPDSASDSAPAPAAGNDSSPAPAPAVVNEPVAAPVPPPALTAGPPPTAQVDLSKSALYDESNVAKISVAGLQNQTPDQAAKIIKLAARANVAPDLIKDDPDGFEKQISDASFSPQNLVKTYPQLANWVAQNQMHLPLIKEDLPNIQQTSDSISDYSGLLSAYGKLHLANQFFHSQFAKETGENLAQSSLSGLAGLARIPNFTYNAVAGLSSPDDKSEQISTTNPVADKLDDLAKQFSDPNSAVNFKIGEEVSKGNYARAGRAAFQQVVSMAPMTAAMILGGAPAVTAFAMGAGADTMNRPENQAASPGASTYDALAHAALMEMSGRVSQGVFAKWEASLATAHGGAAASAIMTGFKQAADYARTVGQGYATGWIMSAGNDAADAGTGVDPDALQGSLARANESGLGMGIFEGAVGSVGHLKAINDAADIRRAQLEKDFLTNLGTTIDASRVKQMAPDSYSSMLDSITQHTPVEFVHVNADALQAYFQTKGEDGVAKAVSDLGIEKQFDQAKAAKGTVEIPTSKWFSDAIPPEARSALADDLTLDPSRATLNEAKAEHELKQKSDAAKTGVDETSEEVFKDIFNQYQQTGQTPDVAFKNAKVMSSFINTVSKSEGKTARQFFDENPVTITKGEAPALPPKNIVAPDATDRDIDKLRKNKVPSEQKAFGSSLVEFLRSRGGVNREQQGQDINDLGIKGLFRKNGMEADKAIETLKENGYLQDHEGIQEVLEKLIKESRGEKQYSLSQGSEQHAEERARLLDLQEAIKGANVDPLQHDNKTIKEALKAKADEIAANRSEYENLVAGGENPDPFTYFQGKEKKEDVKRGFFVQDENGARIALLKDQNLSTALHESMHYFVHTLNNIVESGVASERTKQILKDLTDFAGADSFKNMDEAGHEKISQAFEKYLGEGTAPNKGLRSAFAAFKTWMLQVYGDIKQMLPGVKLNPQIRAAFDRMLSTDQDLVQAKKDAAMHDLFANKPIFVTHDEWTRYQDAKQKRDQASDEYMTAQLLKPIIKAETAARKAERKEVEAQITEQVNNDPNYKILDAIREGKMPGGKQLDKEELRINRKDAVALVGKDVVKELPRGTLSDDGNHPDLLASMISDNMNGTELLEMLANLHPKDEVIQQKTDAEMLSRHAGDDPAMTGKVAEAAQDAIHSSDHAAEAMAFELRWMKENQAGTHNSLMKKINRRLLTAAEFKKTAQTQVDLMSTRDLKPYVFQRAEAKHGNEALNHFVKGDMDAAFESRYHELLNHELFKAATKAADYVEKGLDDFKDFNQPDDHLAKTRDINVINAARVVLDAFGIGSVDRGESAKKYLDKLKNYADDEDQYNATMAHVDDALSQAEHYGDISFSKFVGLKDRIDSLWEMAKENRMNLIDGKKENIEIGKAAIKEAIAGLTSERAGKYSGEGDPGKVSNFKTKFLSIASSLIRVEHWMDALGKGDINNPFTKYIYTPVHEAAARYNEMKNHYIEKVDALSKQYLRDLGTATIPAPELGKDPATGKDRYFTNEAALITALLHTGNESSIRKLLIGRGWGSMDEQGNLNRTNWDQFVARMMGEGKITKDHFDYAQKMWDLLEEMKPDAQRAHKERYGYYFDEITNKPFQTPFGEYKGGYMPATVDRNVNTDASDRAIKNSLETDSETIMWPQKLDGFTKGRNENYNAPLSLNLNLVNNHIDKALKFTYLGPAINQVARTVLDRSVSKAFNDLHPGAMEDIIGPWLKRSMNQSVSHTDSFKALDPVWKYIRATDGMSQMFLNVKNVILQSHGLSLAAVKVPADFLARAGTSYMADPKGIVENMTEKSQYMKNKLSEQGIEMTRSLKDIATNPSKLEKYTEFMRRNTYFLQTSVQNQVNIIAWHGAYDHAISTGHTDREASLLGDAAVSQTQHNFAPESISSIEHGNPFQRLFTMFYSYENMKANLMAGEYYKSIKLQGLQKGAGRAAYVFSAASMIPAVLVAGLGKALGGKPWDESGDGNPWSDFLSKVGMTQIQEFTAMVPIVGQAINAGIKRALPDHKPYDDRVDLSPAMDALVNTPMAIPEAIDAIKKDKWNTKTINDSLTALSLLTGAPLGVLSRPARYLNDVHSGKIAPPTGPVDFSRGLLTGQGAK